MNNKLILFNYLEHLSLVLTNCLTKPKNTYYNVTRQRLSYVQHFNHPDAKFGKTAFKLSRNIATLTTRPTSNLINSFNLVGTQLGIKFYAPGVSFK